MTSKGLKQLSEIRKSIQGLQEKVSHVGEKFSKDNEILKKKIRQMLEIKTQPIKYRE
jgi:hypothetical protein